MGLYTELFNSQQCCLCDSTSDLTGEHKFKASQLKAIFGKESMTMVSDLNGATRKRHAQGPKSSVFHFKSLLCKNCNNSASQKGDNAFDRVHAFILNQLYGNNIDIFSEANIRALLDVHPDVFRYFAKLLCCYIGDSEGPRFKDLCDFAIGKSDLNIVHVNIDLDPTYPMVVEIAATEQYVAHGGLLVLCDRTTGALTEFWNSLTLGPIRYQFGIHMFGQIDAELRQEHFPFWKRCRDAYEGALRLESCPPDVRAES